MNNRFFSMFFGSDVGSYTWPPFPFRLFWFRIAPVELRRTREPLTLLHLKLRLSPIRHCYFLSPSCTTFSISSKFLPFVWTYRIMETAVKTLEWRKKVSEKNFHDPIRLHIDLISGALKHFFDASPGSILDRWLNHKPLSLALNVKGILIESNIACIYVF